MVFLASFLLPHSRKISEYADAPTGEDLALRQKEMEVCLAIPNVWYEVCSIITAFLHVVYI